MFTTMEHEVWSPETEADRDAILHELRSVLASSHFCNSKRYPAFLRYVVEAKLAGKADLLKERTIGIEVFDRPATYDTTSDTVVRYTAGEVRKRLSIYYHELGSEARIHISLPAGSYIPQFLLAADQPPHEASTAVSIPAPAADHPALPSFHEAPPAPIQAAPRSTLRRSLLAACLLFLIAAAAWRYRSLHQQTPLDQFWAPLLRDKKTLLMVSGGVVFQQNNFSGTTTAGKDTEYPFVSMQIADSISRISGVLQGQGANYQLEASLSMPLTELRDRPIILFGAYNNVWTLRLIDPLRYHFKPEPDPSIVDRTNPALHLARDRSQPYAAQDDYALVARFRDTTTGGWVVALSGLGRNGSEAAALFASSPAFMQQLKDRIGDDLLNKNIEVLLKVRVIEGKTGAPSILDAYAW